MAGAKVVLGDHTDQGLVALEDGNHIALAVLVGGLLGVVDCQTFLFTDEAITEVGQVQLRAVGSRPNGQVGRNLRGECNGIWCSLCLGLGCTSLISHVA